MIDFLTAELKLLSLKRADRRLQKAFRKDRIKDEKEKVSYARVQELYQQEVFERSLYLDEIAQIETGKLCREASRYGVFVSQDEDWWESSHVIGGRQLTAKGFSELRSAIRKEKKRAMGLLGTSPKGAGRLRNRDHGSSRRTDRIGGNVEKVNFKRTRSVGYGTAAFARAKSGVRGGKNTVRAAIVAEHKGS